MSRFDRAVATVLGCLALATLVAVWRGDRVGAAVVDAMPAADGCGTDGYPCVGGGPFMGSTFGPGWGAGSNLYGSAEFLMLFVPTIQTPVPLALQSPNLSQLARCDCL